MLNENGRKKVKGFYVCVKTKKSRKQSIVITNKVRFDTSQSGRSDLTGCVVGDKNKTQEERLADHHHDHQRERRILLYLRREGTKIEHVCLLNYTG
jgi:hypothetical protein